MKTMTTIVLIVFIVLLVVSCSMADSGIRVDRCVCRQTPFQELLVRARETGWSLDDLMRETGCGAQCGLCRPYLRAMLASGQTVFHALLPAES